MTTLRGSSQALGIGYSLWLRGRWRLAAAWSLVLALALAVRLLPGLTLPLVFGGGIKLPVPAIVFVVPIVLVPVVALLDVFTYGPIDVSARASPFPLHVRVLPMSTRALVGWPMLFGVVTLVSLWLVLVALVLRPSGLTTSVVWPTTIVIACTAWVQAIAWIPLPLRFVRIPLLFVFAGIPLVLGSVDPRAGDLHGPLVVGMLLWAGAAYATATIGLGRARTGDPRAGLERPSSSRVTPAGRLPPFPSATAARRWYEARRSTSFFTVTLGVVALPLIALSLLAVASPGAVSATRFGAVRIPVPSVASGLFVALVPVVISTSLGGYVGRFDAWRRPGLSSFFALRPVSTARLVGDKLLSAAIAAAAMTAWSILVAASGWWAFVASAPHRLASSGAASDRAGDLVLLAIAYGFFLWRSLAVDLWTTMSGRRWPLAVVVAPPVALALLPLTLAWLATHPAIRAGVAATVPWLVAGALAAKLGGAGAAVAVLRRRRLVSATTIVAFAAAWCAVTAAALAIAAHFTTLSWRSACTVALLVPAARLAAAPIALERNRHR